MMSFEIKTYRLENLPKELESKDINKKYLHRLILLKKGTEIAAQLCLYVNPGITHNNKPLLLFGNMFVATYKQAQLNMLFNKVCETASELNINTIAGPINSSTWDEHRLPLDVEQPCFSGDLNCPLFYSRLLSEAGFKIWHSYYTSKSTAVYHDINEQLHILQVQSIKIRGVNLNDFIEELKMIYLLCMEAFADNELFTPISESEFIEKHLRYQAVLKSKYVLIAEDKDGLAGFIFCYEDSLIAKDALIIKTLARHPHRTYEYLVDTLVKIAINNAVAAGKHSVIHAFMHERNKSSVLSEKFGGRIIRRYGLFVKQLNG